ncbi:MAG: hypothetical protein PVI43_06700 [Candidatus Bathyarchaeota archaeon]|jgi:hypothetical protein
MKMTKAEKEQIEYCKERLKCYSILIKTYGHERTCRILQLYDW